MSKLNPDDEQTIRRFASWKHRRRQSATADADGPDPQQTYAELMKTAFAPALRDAGLRGSAGRFELPSDTHRVQLGFQKLTAPAAPARECYTGSYHLGCRPAAAVLTSPDRILILSALHGLLPLDRVIAPYELRMGEPGSISPMRCSARPSSCTWSTSRR